MLVLPLKFRFCIFIPNPTKIYIPYNSFFLKPIMNSKKLKTQYKHVKQATIESSIRQTSNFLFFTNLSNLTFMLKLIYATLKSYLIL